MSFRRDRLNAYGKVRPAPPVRHLCQHGRIVVRQRHAKLEPLPRMVTVNDYLNYVPGLYVAVHSTGVNSGHEAANHGVSVIETAVLHH